MKFLITFSTLVLLLLCGTSSLADDDLGCYGKLPKFFKKATMEDINNHVGWERFGQLPRDYELRKFDSKFSYGLRKLESIRYFIDRDGRHRIAQYGICRVLESSKDKVILQNLNTFEKYEVPISENSHLLFNII